MPCHEDWSKMSPTQKGVFCKVCTKEVIDFSLMSKEEIIAYLLNAKGSTCGRINSNYLTPITPKYNWGRMVGLASAFFGAVIFNTQKVIAQISNDDNTKSTSNLKQEVSKKVNIFGTISGERNYGGIPYVDIIVTKNDNPYYNFKSDSIGRYSFELLLEKNATYSIQFVSEKYESKKISEINIGNIYEIRPNVFLKTKEKYSQNHQYDKYIVTGGLDVKFAFPNIDTINNIQKIVEIQNNINECQEKTTTIEEPRDKNIRIKQEINRLKEENE